MSNVVKLRDRTIHRDVCTVSPAGQSWIDRCVCGHLRVGHEAANHARVEAGNTSCSGRNGAGACLRCGDCPAFRLKTAASDLLAA